MLVEQNSEGNNTIFSNNLRNEYEFYANILKYLLKLFNGLDILSIHYQINYREILLPMSIFCLIFF